MARSQATPGTLDHFSALEDPRQAWKVIYPLPEILRSPERLECFRAIPLDQLLTDTGFSLATGMKINVARIRDLDPTMNTTAKAEVRAAQAVFVSANGGAAALIDTDGFALMADNVHYTATGQKWLGQAFYDGTSFA